MTKIQHKIFAAFLCLILIFIACCTPNTPTSTDSSATVPGESVETTSQEEPAKKMGGTLYAYQAFDGTRDTFILDKGGTPYILKDIPDELKEKLQDYFISVVYVSYEGEIEETYPAKIHAVDVQDAGLDYVSIEQGFLQKMAELGYKSVVGIPGDYPFLIMTDPYADNNFSDIPVDKDFSDIPVAMTYSQEDMSVTMNYLLETGKEEKKMFPLVTYSLEWEPKYLEPSDDLGYECRQLREIKTVNQDPMYLYASYERYGWRYLNDDYTFSSEQGDVTLTEEELLKLVHAQECYVEGIDWSLVKKQYNETKDISFAGNSFWFADRFLEQTGKKSVWIAGYDNYLRKDTWNPEFPYLDLAIPPALKIEYNGTAVEAQRLTYSWNSTEADADLALQAKDPPVVRLTGGLNEYSLSMSFTGKPYRIKVTYWPEEYTYGSPEQAASYEDKGIEVTVTDGMFAVPRDQAYRFEVYGQWPNGSCWYVFKTEPESVD